MTRKLGISIMTLLMIITAGISPVFASPAVLIQNTTGTPSLVNPMASTTSISVTTDKLTYNDGDKVTITGVTQDYLSSTPITVMIINPIGNIVKIDQVDEGPDRTFTTSITASGALWQAAGAYTVKVQFGSKDRVAETTFNFSGSTGGAISSGPTMKVDGTDFSVKYSITNGQVLGIKADTQSKSLMASVKTTGDGVLTITLPRGLIDSKTADNNDVKYVVLTDGQEANFDETVTTSTDRTLSIPFTQGTSEIEIIGTFVIPEFGPVAAVILVIAIASIIAISKTGLQFGPKY